MKQGTARQLAGAAPRLASAACGQLGAAKPKDFPMAEVPSLKLKNKKTKKPNQTNEQKKKKPQKNPNN